MAHSAASLGNPAIVLLHCRSRKDAGQDQFASSTYGSVFRATSFSCPKESIERGTKIGLNHVEFLRFSLQHRQDFWEVINDVGDGLFDEFRRSPTELCIWVVPSVGSSDCPQGVPKAGRHDERRLASLRVPDPRERV